MHGAVDLAGLIRRGDVSPVELIEAHIGRLERLNPALNALIAGRFEAARAEARAAAGRAGTPGAPPFLGVPCTVKEAIEVEGMPNTAGSYYRREARATKDAPVVRRLREAGFIPLGVSNVSECCNWFESVNILHGRTRNPYDPARHPGGSSGGEAALVGAGLSPLGIGSDLGGSIRMPAFFCGVFGHKPSHGLLPYTGHWPFYDDPSYAWGRDAFPYATIGPLSRTARDLAPALALLRGPDGYDECALDVPLGDPADVSFKGKRVLVLSDPDIHRARRASPELRATTEKAAAHFKTLGATVEALPRRVFRDAFLIWACSLASVAIPPMGELLGGGKQPLLPWEVLRWLVGAERHTAATIEYLFGEFCFKFIRNKAGFVEQGLEIGMRLDADLKDGGILLMPPHPQVARKHNLPMLGPFDAGYTGLFNVLRMPATAVPMGLNAGGLPLGVQVVGAYGNDHVTIAAALELERAFGGWVPPKP